MKNILLKLLSKDGSDLLSNYKDLEEFLDYSNRNNQNIPKIIYSYKNKVENILYSEDKLLNIDSYKIKNDFAYLYYLGLLVSEEQNIVNYSYNADFIKRIYDFYKKEKDIKNLIIFKIIIDLIKNYKSIYNESQKEINYLLKDCIKIIKNHFHILKEYNINLTIDELISKKLYEIYKKIIISLIENFEKINYEKLNDIFSQLGLNNIDITNEISEELLKILDKNNSDDIKILNKKDLFKEKTINLFYILLKFIFKDNYYIYNVPFLLNARKLIINLIKSRQIKYHEINNSKLKYIIEALVYSKYYLNKDDESNYMKLGEVLTYYKFYFFESKKKDIENIENIIKNKKENYKEYEYEEVYKEAKTMNEKTEFIDYLYDLKNTEKENERKEKIDSFNNLEKMLFDKKKKKINKTFKKKLANYFFNNKEKMIVLYNEDIYNFVINLDKQNEENKKDEVTNINGEEPPPLIDKPQNENGKNSQESFKAENNHNSTNPSTFSLEKNNSFSNKKDEVPQNKGGDSAPLPETNISNDDISNIIKNILNFSSITIKVEQENNKNFTYYEELTYGKMATKFDVNKFTKILRIYKGSDKDDDLTKNFKLFIAFLDEFSINVTNKYKNNFTLKIKLNFKNEKKPIDGIFNITCKYTFFQPINNKPHSFIEDNILINRTNSLTTGFQFLIYEINNECYGIHPQEIALDNQGQNIINENSNENIRNILVVPNEKFKIADEDIIIEKIKIIDKEGYYNANIKELDNGFFVYWRNDNTIVICDTNYEIIMEIKESIDLITNIIERVNYDQKKKNIIQLVVSGSIDIILIIIDLNNLKYEIKGYSLSNMYNLNISEMKKNNYILSGKKNCIHTIDLFVLNQIKQNKIDDKTYFGAYKISDNIISLSSNNLLPGGEDGIIFYNTNTKKTTNGKNDIEGYSPIISSSGLSLITKDNIIVNSKKNKTQKSNKILLCACKKYLQKQKNGILIMNANLGDNQKIENPFYDTGNFEVNCFCPISIITNNNKDYNNIDAEYKNKILVEDTDLFFVGGYDIEKRLGIIKLYKVNFGEKTFNTKIEYLQDIEIDNIDSPVNSIIQSKISGNILFNSYSGNIYLFTRPNINYYLNERDKINIRN